MISNQGFPSGSAIKNLSAMQEIQETRVQTLVQEDSLQERMAIHASNRAWKMPWIKEPGRVQSMESQRVNVTEATEHISAMYWLSVFQP